MKLPGVVVVDAADINAQIEIMDQTTTEWMMQAARGECGWVCPDCCLSFPEGMPDACPHGHQECTDLNKRDKQAAVAQLQRSECSNGLKL